MAVVVLLETGILLGSALGFLYLLVYALLWKGVLSHGFGGSPNLLELIFGGAMVGAPFGATMVTALGLTVLRRLPIGRALTTLSIGGVVGVIAAALLKPDILNIALPILVTGMTMTGGAITARRSLQRAQEQVEPGGAAG